MKGHCACVCVCLCVSFFFCVGPLRFWCGTSLGMLLSRFYKKKKKNVGHWPPDCSVTGSGVGPGVVVRSGTLHGVGAWVVKPGSGKLALGKVAYVATAARHQSRRDERLPDALWRAQQCFWFLNARIFFVFAKASGNCKLALAGLLRRTNVHPPNKRSSAWFKFPLHACSA